jgi:NAD-dependent SIR2 family protein deacetylase
VYDNLTDLVTRGRVVILSGAGLSTESGIPDYRGATGIAARGGPVEVVRGNVGHTTESGIPDYRGPTGAARPATPMPYQVFIGSPEARQRYWARSHLGWRFIAGAEPNTGHLAVAALQLRGRLDGVITQNVDGLHQAAGAHDVIELHGALDRVRCLRCGEISSRASLDLRLRETNPGWSREEISIKPHGDVDLDDVTGFVVVDCLVCGGLLKPDVVFFGETVPPDRVVASFELVDAASCLLVLGSSLTVMSGYRFVLRAAKAGIPVAIVNQGPTRGDDKATVRVDAPLGSVLTALVDAAEGR